MDEIVTTEIPLSTAQRAPAEADLQAAGERLRELQREAQSLGATPAAAEIHLAMGRIYADRLGDARSAARCFQNAFRLDPDHRPNLEAARRLFAAGGQLDRARALFEREEALLASPLERAESLRAQAALLSRGGMAGEAARRLSRALDLAPDHPALLSQAADQAGAAGDRRACAKLLARAAAAVHDEVHKACFLRRAVLLYDELLAEDPRDGIAPPAPGSDAEALQGARDEALEQLHAADPSDPLAALGLLRRAQESDDWETVLRLSRERADRTGAPAERALVACIAAFRLGRAADAIAELRSSLEDARRDGPLLALLSALVEQQDSPDLPHALRLRATASADASERADLKVVASSLAADPLDQEQLLADALADNPGDAAAIALHARLVALRDPAAAAERFATLAGAVREQAPLDAAAYDLEAAAFFERAGLRAEAAAIARSALAAAPATPTADAALRLLQRTLPPSGGSAELVGLLEAASAPLPRGPAAELLARAAAFAADEPELRGRSVELAQRAAELARGLTAPRTLEGWTAVALRAGDLRSFARALETRAASAKGADAAELLIEAAEVARATGDYDRAIDLHRKARAADPSSQAARTGLLSMPGLPRDERIELLAEEARAAQPARAAGLHAEHAALLEAAGRIDDAAQSCAQALSVGGADSAVLRRLARLQARRGDGAAALALLVRLAQSAPEGPARAEAYGRAAEYAEWRLGDAHGAIELYATAAEACPAASFALTHLGRLNAWIGRFAEAADAFEKLASSSSLAAEKVEALRWAASLHACRTRQPDRAVELYRRLLADSSDDVAAMAALLPLVAGASGLEERAELRAKLATRCRDARQAALLRAESAQDRLAAGDRDRAVAELRRALALNPRDRIALDAVEDILRSTGSPRLLAQHLAFRGAHADGTARAALALERGDLLAEAGDWEQASAAYEQALASDPGSSLAARRLDRIAARAADANPGSSGGGPTGGERRQTDEVALAEAARHGDRVALRRLANRTEETDPEHALEAHRALLALEPFAVDSLRAMVRIFARQGRSDAVAVAAATLVGIGAGTAEDAAVYEAEAKRPPPGDLPRLDDDDALRAPGDEGAVRELLLAAAHDLTRAFGADLSGRGKRVRGDNPVRRVCAAIAKALAMGEPALYLAKNEPDVVLAAATDPPGLLVGLEVPKRLRPRQQRFVYARALAHIRRGTHVVAALAPEQLGRLAGELVRVAAPRGTDLSRLPERDRAVAGALERTLSRESRAQLAPLAAHAAAGAPSSWPALALSMRETAERTAMIICGDPAAALQIVAFEVGAGVERPEVARLAAFAVGETYLRVKAR